MHRCRGGSRVAAYARAGNADATQADAGPDPHDRAADRGCQGLRVDSDGFGWGGR
jgi:hypothetical protein